MNARQKVLMKILDKADVILAKKLQDEPKTYEDLLKKLLVQAFLKLMEEEMIVRCLAKDVAAIEKVLPGAVQLYKEICKRELEMELPILVEIDKKNFLEERKIVAKTISEDDVPGDTARVPKNEEDKKCIGRVLVMTPDGSIVCKNTIDIRLDVTFQESLPNIRKVFFPN